jgi:hypothetical protein
MPNADERTKQLVALAAELQRIRALPPALSVDELAARRAELEAIRERYGAVKAARR